MTFEKMKATNDVILNNGGNVLLPDAGRSISMMEGTVTFKTESEETGGAWSLLELTVPPKFSGPPPHLHKVTQEAFYVLEGTLTLQVGDQTVKAPPGAYVFIPTGITHTYSNDEDKPARYLGFVSPGGFEKYFDELAVLVQSEQSWPPADMGKVFALMAKYDTYAPMDKGAQASQ